MDAVQRRIIVGVAGLALLWIVVYWAWEPRAERGPTVTFMETTDRARDAAAVVEPEPEPPIIEVEDGGAASVEPPGEEAGDAGPEEDSFGEPPFRWLVARDGDTLEKIAAREFGDRTLWTAIARANPLKDPTRLRAGDRLKIPLDPSNPQGRPDEPVEAPAAPEVTEYTVRAGDTLSKIAQQFYGSVRYVDYIFEANRDRLSSPDALRLDQVLVIPPKPEDGTGG